MNFKKHDLSCSDHDHGFCLSSIKIYFEIGIWLFSNKHAALREKTYDKTVNYWLLDGWYPHCIFYGLKSDKYILSKICLARMDFSEQYHIEGPKWFFKIGGQLLEKQASL